MYVILNNTVFHVRRVILVPRVILIANSTTQLHFFNIVVDHMAFSWLLLSYRDFKGSRRAVVSREAKKQHARK